VTPQSQQPAQAEGSVPQALPRECAWCAAEVGELTPGATHGICYRHLRQVRRQNHERRERIERMRALLT
jgi:hypothetical protein